LGLSKCHAYSCSGRISTLELAAFENLRGIELFNLVNAIANSYAGDCLSLNFTN
jgi:hypothetical protein